jgi:protein TonB
MTRKIHFRRFLPGLAAVTLVAAVGIGVTVFINQFMDAEPPRKKKTAQKITLIKPPPPPPKLEERPPEPEIEEEKVDIPEPEPLEDVASDEPPMGEELGLDADGSGAGDSFGLKAKKGGRELAYGSIFGGYAGTLQKHVEKVLQRDEAIRSRGYRISVRLWVDGDGRISRVSLRNSTGKPDVDNAIISSLTGSRVKSAPPLEDRNRPYDMRISVLM